MKLPTHGKVSVCPNFQEEKALKQKGHDYILNDRFPKI